MDDRQHMFHLSFLSMKNLAWVRVIRMLLSPHTSMTSFAYFGCLPMNDLSRQSVTEVKAPWSISRLMFWVSRIPVDHVDTVRAAGPVWSETARIKSRSENCPFVMPTMEQLGVIVPMQF